MFLPCRPCCEGVPGCNDPAAAPNKPITDPAAEGEWVPSGTWGWPQGAPSGNTFNGITWTFVPNTSGTGGSTWFFYGSEETSNADGNATLAEQQDWNNICNWYSSSNAAPYYHLASAPDLKTRLDKRASKLPTAGATIHFYTTPNLSTSGPKTCAVAYFHLGEIESGGMLTTTGSAIDSPGGAVFLTGGTTYSAGNGGVSGIHVGAARYHGFARLYGQQTGDAVFGGRAGMWGGTVTGNVTLEDNSYNDFGTARSAVSGNLISTISAGYDHHNIDITGTATVSGDGRVLKSTCGGAATISAGQFSGHAGSTVTVTGSGSFGGSCVGALTATGTGSVGAADLISPYYAIPTATINGSVECTTGGSGSFGTITCYDTSTLRGVVTGSASMYDSSNVIGDVTGDVDLYDTAWIGSFGASTAVVTGTVVFNGAAKCGKVSSLGKVLGNATFNDSSSLETGSWVEGNATFNDTSICSGHAGTSVRSFSGSTQTGVATFNDSACCTLLYRSSTYTPCFATGNLQEYWTPTPHIATGLSCNGTAPSWYCNTTDTCGCG